MILVTGGTGQLGTALRKQLPDAVFPHRSKLDLMEGPKILRYLSANRPEAIINCAAYTGVDAAELEEPVAHAVNSGAVAVMAAYAAEAAIPLVTFSTDHVFSGEATTPYVETSETGPVNAYGRSKLAGEVAVHAAYPGALIIRTSWIVSPTHHNFIAAILRRAVARGVAVVDDQWGTPTVAADLATATVGALAAGVTGVLHLRNRGDASRFELARAAVAEAGLDPCLVRPCATSGYVTEARRPRYAVLGSERCSALGLELPDWRTSLPGVVAGQMVRV